MPEPETPKEPEFDPEELRREWKYVKGVGNPDDTPGPVKGRKITS